MIICNGLHHLTVSVIYYKLIDYVHFSQPKACIRIKWIYFLQITRMSADLIWILLSYYSETYEMQCFEKRKSHERPKVSSEISASKNIVSSMVSH